MKAVRLENVFHGRLRACGGRIRPSTACRPWQLAPKPATRAYALTADKASEVFESIKEHEDVYVRATLVGTDRGFGLKHEMPEKEVVDEDAEDTGNGEGVIDESVVTFLPASYCISAEHEACWPFVRCACHVRTCAALRCAVHLLCSAQRKNQCTLRPHQVHLSEELAFMRASCCSGE